MITTAQLIAAGVGEDAIRQRVKQGRLVRLHRGVYQVGPLATEYGHEMAALLACGPDAALSHQTAASLWGLLSKRSPSIHVTTTSRGRKSRPGLRIHHTPALDAAVHHGLRLTTPTRTLQDLAATTTQSELDRAVEQALILKLTTRAALADTTGRGAAALRTALRTEPSFTRSEAERRLKRLIHDARLPAPRTNVRVAGWEVDALWPEHRLVVEVDGYAFHGGRHAFERDRRRDADLLAAGYRVVRFTWRQLAQEPLAVVARIAQLLQVAVP